MKAIWSGSRRFFRQLRDSPEAPAGTIFVTCVDNDERETLSVTSLYGDKTGNTIWYDQENVINNPTWFEEIEPIWVLKRLK